MYRSFRFVPPEPRPEALTRPRLLRSLAGRWNHRVTSITGGPGLGKTTLLAQAIAENRLAPRGDDVWIGLGRDDVEVDRLARVVAAAFTGDHHEPDAELTRPDPGAVADAVWRRAPTEACLVLDDLHHLKSGSRGAAWLGDLVDTLPANGHVLVAGRSNPPIPLARLSSQGGLLRLGEDDLRFSDEEIQGFASRRGVDPARFDEVGRWPAMAELAANVDQPGTTEYLWEEVLEPLGTMRRHILAVLCELGGADDELLSAAVGTPVELESALEGVPLVDCRGDRWYVPHGLWRTADGLDLTPGERTDIRRRAATHLSGRGRFDEAFSLLQESEMWDVAPTVLRDACLARDHLVTADLRRWLARSPESVRESTAGVVATALHTAFAAPGDSVELLERAVARCREDGDIEGELTTLAHQARVGWWAHEVGLVDDVVTKMAKYEAAGHPEAHDPAALCRALLADLQGDDRAVLDELASIAPANLDPAWDIAATWLHGVVHVDVGEPQMTAELVERLSPQADAPTSYVLDALRITLLWLRGRVDEAVETIEATVPTAQRAGVALNLHIGLTMASMVYSQLGHLDMARWCLQASAVTAPPSSEDGMPMATAIATAMVQLTEGDEAAAVETLRTAMAGQPPDTCADRRLWHLGVADVYVGVPETRGQWDANPPPGDYAAAALTLARAVVAIREGRGDDVVRDVELPDMGLVRATLHYRLGAELAVGLSAAGRSEGARLLEALGPPGRDAVRSLAGSDRPHLSQPAKSLLATVPSPPPQPTYVAVLGPLVLRRGGPDGTEHSDPDLRRRRVHALLAYLVGHRQTSRSAIVGALWPHLDERSAANNLSVTLNHLLRLLEPWRASGEPPYLLRLEAQTVQLVTGEHLRIDVDDFDQHYSAAMRAEHEGLPSLALDHHRAAAAVYRGDLHLDAPDADWYELDREHYRVRFVASATRAGELLLARREGERAEALARRALDVDPWSEAAYSILVGSALGRGDRSGARRLLHRCRAVLADLGAQPSGTTRQLERRLQAAMD